MYTVFCAGIQANLARPAICGRVVALRNAKPNSAPADDVVGAFVSVRVLPPRITIAPNLSRSGTRMTVREHEGEFWGKG